MRKPDGIRPNHWRRRHSFRSRPQLPFISRPPIPVPMLTQLWSGRLVNLTQGNVDRLLKSNPEMIDRNLNVTLSVGLAGLLLGRFARCG